MDPIKQSYIFNPTILFWKIFGFWSDKSSSIYFRLFSSIFIVFSSISFFLFFTISLMYTPRTVEIFSTQIVFYFTALSGVAKIDMIIRKRQKIISTFEIIDCTEFRGNDEKTYEYVRQFKTSYIRYFRTYAAYCNISGYIFLVVLPLLNYYLREQQLKLPLYEYYFLNEEIRNKYFFYWYVHQTTGLVSAITTNITSHTFLCGLLSMAVTQFQILNWNVANIRLDDGEGEVTKNKEEMEQIYLNKLYKCLNHYEIILKYCQNVQDLTDFLICSQFGLAALSLCFCMYMFVLDTNDKDLVFMGCYIIIMILENFVPSLLGSRLTYESDNLRFAAYSNNWPKRSKRFKTSLMILMVRAQRCVVITGLKMVPVSLGSFLSIVKTAYSFFTLLRSVQDQSS